MPITSSDNFIDAHTQSDGSRYCKQVCTDSVGGVHQRIVNLAPGNDGVTLLAQYVVDLDESLKRREFYTVLESDTTLTLEHLTKEELASWFWQALMEQYQESKERFGYLIWWLSHRITGGDFTSNQVRLSFNVEYGRSLNPSQWDDLVTTRFIPIHDRYQAMLDEADL